MTDGTSSKLPKNATKAQIVAAASRIWAERNRTAQTSGKKLQQGAFCLQVEDGPTYFVRPRTVGLEFYIRADFGVTFERTEKAKSYGLEEKPKRQKPPAPAPAPVVPPTE